MLTFIFKRVEKTTSIVYTINVVTNICGFLKGLTVDGLQSIYLKYCFGCIVKVELFSNVKNR